MFFYDGERIKPHRRSEKATGVMSVSDDEHKSIFAWLLSSNLPWVVERANLIGIQLDFRSIFIRHCLIE